MGDPLYIGGIGLAVVLITLLKVVVTFVFLLVAVMLMVWFERKIISDMQHRIGPNRAGPWGILQTFADGIKLFFKEDLLPEKADKRVFRLAPLLALVPAFLAFAIIPVGGAFGGGHDGTISIFGHRTYLQLADPPIGVLFFLAMSGVAVYGVMLAGWASGSKYPLLGSVRATAQIVSYEAALGLSLASVFLVTGSVSTHGIVAAQAGAGFRSIIPNWNLFVAGFVPFVIFVIAGTAELNRPPFDMVEAEQELVGGFNTEYSSIRFALFFLAEFMNTVTMSALIVTLFLGGPSGPLWFGSILSPLIWFFMKLLVFLFMFVWFRGTLPRMRYDQLMDLGWKRLIPLALGWFLVLGAIRVIQGEDLSVGQTLLASLGILGIVAIAGTLFSLSLRAGERNQAEAEEAMR